MKPITVDAGNDAPEVVEEALEEINARRAEEQVGRDQTRGKRAQSPRLIDVRHQQVKSEMKWLAC